MRKAAVLTFLTLILAIPLSAAPDKHQSYFAYDDGGTVVRQGEDGREIDVRVNLPVFPGDEVVTSRRGRSEIRLSDGNIVAIDRATSLLFKSMLDSYEGDASQTIAELRYGKVMVFRTDLGRDFVRLDTSNASYVASHEALYSVESDAHGADRVTVFEGTIEVRTPNRSTRLRSGETAEVDDRGLSDISQVSSTTSDDFERWFMKRIERYGQRTSRYLDNRFAYYDDDFDSYGRWVYVTGIGYSWRPYVGAGWRPYYNGYWIRGRSGCLVWVSYEPWGWLPYHYGRWAFDPGYGWVWVPGGGYAPAWVYWWYSPGYIGWAPSGWWDCYRPYYNWAYQPYRRHGIDFGYGFYGRVRVRDVDLQPWTFLDANNIVSTRVDRAALTTDAVRQRLQRGGDGGFATISSNPARFTRNEFRDPSAAIQRRTNGSGTGNETGSPADLTPFIRRDPDLGSSIRDRVVRTRPTDSTKSPGATVTVGGGSIAPIGGGSVAPIGSGGVAPIGRGSVAPTPGSSVDTGRINRNGDSGTRSNDGGTRNNDGGIRRGNDTNWRNAEPREPVRDTPGRIEREPSDGAEVAPVTPNWRDRIGRPAEPVEETKEPAPSTGTAQEPGDKLWRDRGSRGSEGGSSNDHPPATTEREKGSSSDVPRRIIDRIGGARVVPRDSDGGNSSGSSGRNRGSSGDHSSGRSSSSSGDSGGSSSSSGSGGGSSSASAPPPPPPP
ncbi:MAG TPA: DUF6600 domain-containing protein, partial [Thermoanaerobaculia bacterium]|nr:DUF6600 domain-containing protein [Thermoanaerobaculia bacterium]